jgi:large subunit ribosomal protein L13
MEDKTYTIDAEGKILGRLASKIAMLLRGKNRGDFAPNKNFGDLVVIKNVGKIKFSGKKINKKVYYRHTGYIGGLKESKLKSVFEKDPKRVLRTAVYGMLPKNRLRNKQIRRLKMT